jgi:hypothetical protein
MAGMRPLWLSLVALGACAQGTSDQRYDPDAMESPFIDADPQIFVDAAPPDACVPQWKNLLVDPAFDEGGAAWTQTPAAVVAPAGSPAPETPPNAAYLGNGVSQDQILAQAVTVPADASMLRVRGVRDITTSENPLSPYDKLAIELRSADQVVLEALPASQPTWSNLTVTAGFEPFELVATMPYAGMAVTLTIHVTTDASIPTSFVLDSLAVEALTCTP